LGSASDEPLHEVVECGRRDTAASSDPDAGDLAVADQLVNSGAADRQHVGSLIDGEKQDWRRLGDRCGSGLSRCFPFLPRDFEIVAAGGCLARAAPAAATVLRSDFWRG
jgi:hypothetical protein